MMHRFLGVFLALLVMSGVWANDTAVQGASGTVTPLAGEHASIRMVNETVHVDIYPRYYDVQAEFLFHNTGKATTVTMGFPETGEGDGYAQYRNRTAFTNFRTTVDGKLVTARRQLGKAPHEMSYLAWWMKDVTFAAGQLRRVTVAYRAPVGEVALGERWATYHFTGGNWAGTVGSSRLRVRLHLNGTYAVHSNVPLVEDRDGLSATWHDWEAEETATISFQRCGRLDLAIRGLDIPRGDDHFNWLSSRVRILNLHEQGIQDPAKNQFIPAAFYTEYDGGQTFIAARAMQEYFAARCPEIPAPQISWNAKTHETTFAYLGQRLQFRVADNDAAATDGQTGIIRSYPWFGEQRSMLYLPAVTLQWAFGMRTRTDYINRTVSLQFPTPESGITELKGTYYRILVGEDGSRVGNISVVNLADGQVRCSFPYPPPTRIVSGSGVPSAIVVDHFLLLPYGLEGAPILRCFDLQKSCETGTLTDVWQESLSCDALLPTGDRQAFYVLSSSLRNEIVIEKRAFVDGSVRWRRDIPQVLANNHRKFIAEQAGYVAYYTAEDTDEGIADPADVILLDAQDGHLLTRYQCSLADVTPERLPHKAAGPTNTRAFLNMDNLLLAGTYGHGLWRSNDGEAWAHITDHGLPTHIVSLGASRQGDIAAGTWMQDGLAFRSSLDSAFRLLAWPSQPRWPSWWSREYSRCMTVGFSGDTLYVQTFGGFLRWTPNAGWERTTIPDGEANTVINDSGIWTTLADGKRVRIRHYTPAGVCDLASEIPASASEVDFLAVNAGHLFVFLSNGRILSATPAEVRRQTMHEVGCIDRGRAWGNSFLVYHETGDHPAFIIGTPQGAMIVRDGSAVTLDPSLAGYTDAFATYRDTTGEWLVMGGKDGVVMLPSSVIRASLLTAVPVQ